MRKFLYLTGMFLAGFAGVEVGMIAANHAPVLTGANAAIPNAVVFLENATPANLSASGGALTIKAGASGQQIILTPSGSAQTILNGGLSTTASRSHFVAASEPYAIGVKYMSSGGEVYFGAASSSATPDAVVSNSGGAEIIRFTNGQQVGVGGIVPSYALDVLGAINTSDKYRVGGTAGVSGSISVNTTSGSAVSSVSAPTSTALVSILCSTSTIQYVDWSGTHQSATFVTGCSAGTGSFVTTVTPTTGTFLTGASASSNTFTGGIKTN